MASRALLFTAGARGQRHSSTRGLLRVGINVGLYSLHL